MKTLEIAKNITLFFIGLTLIIAFFSYKNNNFNLSTYEILVLILLFSIAIGIHCIIIFLDDINSLNIMKTLNKISKNGLLASLI